MYKEDTFSRDADRREIVRLLVGNEVQDENAYGSPPTLSGCEDYSFRQSPNNQSIVFRGPVEDYPVARNNKTVARLERGSPFPPIAAMSGWSHGAWDSILMSGKDWTREVMRIAAVAGHDLAPHDCD